MASLPYLNLQGSMRTFEMSLLLHVTSPSCPPTRSRYPFVGLLDLARGSCAGGPTCARCIDKSGYTGDRLDCSRLSS